MQVCIESLSGEVLHVGLFPPQEATDWHASLEPSIFCMLIPIDGAQGLEKYIRWRQHVAWYGTCIDSNWWRLPARLKRWRGPLLTALKLELDERYLGEWRSSAIRTYVARVERSWQLMYAGKISNAIDFVNYPMRSTQ